MLSPPPHTVFGENLHKSVHELNSFKLHSLTEVLTYLCNNIAWFYLLSEYQAKAENEKNILILKEHIDENNPTPWIKSNKEEKKWLLIKESCIKEFREYRNKVRIAKG